MLLLYAIYLQRSQSEYVSSAPRGEKAVAEYLVYRPSTDNIKHNSIFSLHHSYKLTAAHP